MELENLTKEQRLIVRREYSKFNERISDYNNKYPEMEQLVFAPKVMFAEKVLAGGSSYYIEKIAELKGITPIELAQYILFKANEFELYYTAEEVKRDIKIYELLSVSE